MYRLNEFKPATIYSQFVSGLKGHTSKMSSSDPSSAIFLDDSSKQIKKKINTYAFSGGGDSLKLHREHGGNTSVDIPFHYLQFFLENDQQLDEIKRNYSSGDLLTGELKKIATQTIQELISAHQSRKSQVTEEIEAVFRKVRQIK